MKSLAEQMSMYSAYHQNPVNKMIHFLFVPAIVWTLMVALDLLPLLAVAGITVTAAMVITAVLLVWYLVLDFPLGVVSAAVFTMLLVSAITLNESVGPRTALTIAAVLFVASWVFQFVGHGVWEKRRPALADNLLQVFVAPIFLVAETAFAMGLRKDLREDVHRRMRSHLPAKEQAASTA